MAQRTSNDAASNQTATAHLAKGMLLALLTVMLPASSHAQEKAAKEPAQRSIVTLGTTKAKVDSLLGAPRTGWAIPSLCRSMYIYPDGTKVIFVDERVISSSPNGLAEGSPDKGYTVERDGRQILFEPIILRGVAMAGPLGEIKHQVEERFYFVPPNHVIPIPTLPPPPPNYISLRRMLGWSWQP